MTRVASTARCATPPLASAGGGVVVVVGPLEFRTPDLKPKPIRLNVRPPTYPGAMTLTATIGRKPTW